MRSVWRALLSAAVFYNVGAGDWEAAVTCAAIGAAVELGIWWTRVAERREAERVAAALDSVRDLRANGGRRDPFSWYDPFSW